jgi:ribosomal protein L21E
MTEQLSLFDIPEEETFEVGDKVKVKDIDEIDYKMSIEDVTYITAYGGKKGKVVGIHKGKATSYQVQLNNGELIWAYARELILLG